MPLQMLASYFLSSILNNPCISAADVFSWLSNTIYCVHKFRMLCRLMDSHSLWCLYDLLYKFTIHVVLIVTSSPFSTLVLNTVSIAVITFCASSSIDLFHIWLVQRDPSQMCGSTWRIHIYSITLNASMTAMTPMITSSASPTDVFIYKSVMFCQLFLVYLIWFLENFLLYEFTLSMHCLL